VTDVGRKAITGALLLGALIGGTALQLDGGDGVTYAAFSDFDAVGNHAGSGVWGIGDPPPECAGMKFKNVIIATMGPDTIVGTNHSDLIFGLGGDDVITSVTGEPGNNGKDCIAGGSGNDRLEGGNAKDVLVGGTGDDVLFGANGPDKLFGGTGTDHCDGGLAPEVVVSCEMGPSTSAGAP
jgi:Ca2+-binding RTX toxin-like protein